MSDSLCRDPQIIGADRPANALERVAYNGVCFGRRSVDTYRRVAFGHLVDDLGLAGRPASTLSSSKEEFSYNHSGEM